MSNYPGYAYPPNMTTNGAGKGGAAAGGVDLMQEHPVQVPVRVVNPHDMKGGESKGGNLRLKLDLNLDVEVTLKASLRGEVSLSLL
jgi:hypothetical protein